MNSNDKRNQLENYLSEVTNAERKKKRKTTLIVLFLATVGISTATGIWYVQKNKLVYRTLAADEMTIYKMDSVFKNNDSPVILTYKFHDKVDTVSSVDEYLELDGVISSSISEVPSLLTEGSEAPQDSSLSDLVENATLEVEKEKTGPRKTDVNTKKTKQAPNNPSLRRYIFDVAGNREVGEELGIKIEDYNAKIVYVLDFGNGQKQRIRENKRYTYKKAGNYTLRLIATNAKGARSIYSKTIKINPEIQSELAENKEVEGSAGASNSTSISTQEREPESAEEPVVEELLSLAEKSEIPVEKEAETTPKATASSREMDNVDSSAPLTFAEKMPNFPGGAKSMYKFLNKKLNYPPLARDNEVQGKVYVQFLVDVDGSLSKFKVVRGLGFGCDEEALRIARLMPKWVPGEHGGRKVPVIYTLAVNYKF